MQLIARFFSTILSPLLMPVFGVFLAFWTSVLFYLPLGTRFVVLLVIFALTCILPMVIIAILHNFGIVTDKGLNIRKERWLPYLATIACYVAAGFYLNHIHSPFWLCMFMFGGAFACVISMIITFWWKISAHMAGVAGVLALLLRIHSDGLGAYNMFWIICIMILLCGCLGSSRIALNRHTFWQVVAGFVNGFVCVYFATGLN